MINQMNAKSKPLQKENVIKLISYEISKMKNDYTTILPISFQEKLVDHLKNLDEIKGDQNSTEKQFVDVK